MKLDQKQLRRIINEIVRMRLSESDGTMNEDDENVEEVGGGAADAMTEKLLATLSDPTTRRVVLRMWTARDPEPMVPSRIEDVEHFAEKLTDRVLSNTELRDELVRQLSAMMRLSM